MCGISGQLKYHGEADRGLVERMTRAMLHRGPDGEGYHVEGPIGLGMRRLAIIDLQTGDQPIFNEDRTIAVVFNGEIYNYRELKAELEKLGHRFATRSDTETIVHAYEQWGLEFLDKLDGMFGISLWDKPRGRLVLARDRAGEKPLYYSSSDDGIVWASELKALVANPGFSREIDRDALHLYFNFGRVPSPLTIFKGAKKLPPAHYLVAEQGRVQIERYWQASYREKLAIGLPEAKAELLKLLTSAVRSQMVADVPLGAYLSGGLDSSAVVALMAESSSAPVKTFSAGFKDEDYSELKYASLVAQHLGTDHHEFILEPDILGLAPKLAWHLDEPFSDYSIFPSYYIAEATRRQVTVALTGDGGDELFAGYETYKALRLAAYYRRFPVCTRDLFYRATRAVPDNDRREGPARYFHKLRRFAETQQGRRNAFDSFLAMSSGYSEEELRGSLYTESLGRSIGIDARAHRQAIVDRYDGSDEIEAILASQFESLLPDMFFAKVDRTSMAVSLETRSPLVARAVAEFAFRLPFDLKLHGLTTKYIFKETMRGRLPDAIIDRHKKGFTMPLERWLRDGKTMAVIKETVLDEAAMGRGLFRREYISRLVEDHLAGRANNTDKIWRLYMWGVWRSSYGIDRPVIT